MNEIAQDQLTGRRSGGPYRPSRRLIDELVRAAAAAPSMHDTQPWRFRIEDAGSTIKLHADPARMLPVGDPDGRAAHIACGAALLNVRVAAAVAAGLRPDIRLLPDPGQPLLLAEAACLEGAMLAFPDRDEAARVLRLAAEAERDLLADPASRAELARWAGGYRDRDGIPGSAGTQVPARPRSGPRIRP